LSFITLYITPLSCVDLLAHFRRFFLLSIVPISDNLNGVPTITLLSTQEELAALKRTVENIKDPLYRFFERECTIGRNLLKTVLTDLNDVAQVSLKCLCTCVLVRLFGCVLVQVSQTTS
jgi:hypothetical protein